jgi:predicted Zn-dependent protease
MRKSWLRPISCACICLATASLTRGQEAAQPQGLLKQGYGLHQQARFTEAVTVLEKARTLAPEDYFINLLLGIDLLRAGRTEAAISPLKAAARLRPREEFPEDYLAEAEATLHRPALAVEAYQKALQRGSNSETALEAWAGFCLERFRQIAEQLRSSPGGVSIARRLEANRGAAATCSAPIPVLEQRLALQRNPAEGNTAYDLSVCYAAAASAAAGELQAKAEDPGALHRLRGDVLLRLKNDPAAAESEYQQAILQRPGDPLLLSHLAEAQLAAGKSDAAESSARAALAIDPHQKAALHTLSAIALANRDYQHALGWLNALAAQDPRDPEVQAQLGRALAQLGQPQQAVVSIESALHAGYADQNGALHALLASVFRKLGREQDSARAEAEARRLSAAEENAAQPTPPTSSQSVSQP